jgi:hypothetical protein
MKARRTTGPVIRSERGDRDRFAPESRPTARHGGLPRWARERTRYRGRAWRGRWLCAVEALTMLIERR